MKVKTDSTTGVTTCDLEEPDRNKLAAAKTLLVKVAVATNGTPQAEAATDLANAIGGYMAVDAARNKPADKPKSEPPAK